MQRSKMKMVEIKHCNSITYVSVVEKIILPKRPYICKCILPLHYSR